MGITLCTQKEPWEGGRSDQPDVEGHDQFLQSWGWGQFQRETGKEVAYVQSGNSHFLVITHKLPLGFFYAYIPRASWKSVEDLATCIGWCQEQGFVFVRIEPAHHDVPELPFSFKQTKTRQPGSTLYVSLAPEQDDILRAMHSKTRYNVRLAKRKGVEVREQKDVDVFWELNEQTTQRDKFKSHGKEYYRAMLALEMIQQYTAYYEGEPVAAVITCEYGNQSTYVHGVSSNRHRNVMAPYALQWYAIGKAKERGALWYDLWGVAPPPADEQANTTSFHNYTWLTTHPWTGITRFKAGLSGGQGRVLPSAVDVVLRPGVYSLYSIARKFL